MAWKVEFIQTAERQLQKLDRTAAIRIARYLQETVANGGDPRQRGKGLTATLAGLWRYRVGDYPSSRSREGCSRNRCCSRWHQIWCARAGHGPCGR